MSRVYANLFILLVAPPGVGKSIAIFQGRELADATRKLKIAPDDVTKASLVDHLMRAGQNKVYDAKTILQYHSLDVFADEFGVFCPSHDTGFLSVMNALYDNRAVYKESRRGREEDLIIINPQVNMLAGTQPDFLANLLPPEAWGMGFMSRMLMVYSSKKIQTQLFGKRLRVETKDLLEDLKVIAELYGEMSWEKAAEDELERWYDTGMLPEPEHTKLKHYVPRRILTTLKLCMVSSASRGNHLCVDTLDVIRARDWLLEIEASMPDVFKDMAGNNDLQLMQDLHYYLWNYFMNQVSTDEKEWKKKAIHRSRIEVYLSAKTPPYNVEHLIKIMKSAGAIIEVAPDRFIPGPHNSLRFE